MYNTTNQLLYNNSCWTLTWCTGWNVLFSSPKPLWLLTVGYHHSHKSPEVPDDSGSWHSEGGDPWGWAGGDGRHGWNRPCWDGDEKGAGFVV